MVGASQQPEREVSIQDIVAAAVSNEGRDLYDQNSTGFFSRPQLRGSRIAQVARSISGSDEGADRMLSILAADFIAEMAIRSGLRSANSQRLSVHEAASFRSIVLPGNSKRRGAVVFFDPSRRIDQTQCITASIPSGPSSYGFAMHSIGLNGLPRELELLGREVFSEGPRGIMELFDLASPEVIVVREPNMVQLCAPSSPVPIKCGGKLSSVGVLCRDRDGDIGVTGCFHGTGGQGTSVWVDQTPATVKSTNMIQDISFIPVPTGFGIPQMQNVAGIRQGSPPMDDPATFCGATSGNVTTYISSFDRGLLRRNPTLQLKIQTPPDTNSGDSGAALVHEDKVIGFAFQRTAYGEIPAMADWIWAANAMESLSLETIP